MAAESGTTYEAVIGLESHVELLTKTKLFCGCPSEFGSEPNTNVCPVCLGLPGSLPVLNERAVELALRLAEALEFDVPERSVFARKNYFYPDMPKDFQISQYEAPILADGRLEVDGAVVGIERAHLEEDTGKTMHVGGGGRIHEASHSLVDYNRAGVPLMEIVSRPDIRSAEQARAYITELRAVLRAIGLSDVKMEEGSMRVDANVSLRPTGSTELGTKVEIKNMNSLRSLGRAIEHEIGRQAELLDAGERIAQETRHWDESDGRTHGMRSKEGSSDYRYFPEPDLLPVEPTAEQRARAAQDVSGTNLPSQDRAKLVELGISEQGARTLVGAGLATHTTTAVVNLTGGEARDVENLELGPVLAHINETGESPTELRLTGEGTAELVDLVAAGSISRNQAKEVAAVSLSTGQRPEQVVEERGLAQVSDESELSTVIDEIIDANPKEADAYRAGDEKARKKLQGFFIGKAMQATKGQANGKVLQRLLDTRLGG
ncbi:MAG: Asp-tRNA(Asn)/Glu-tRNA(Gln) amidotransferase subunit GatB [Acidimicrobiia bacterium]